MEAGETLRDSANIDDLVLDETPCSVASLPRCLCRQRGKDAIIYLRYASGKSIRLRPDR